MGQPIIVVEKPSQTPGIARFELNRSLTGMGHERYGSAEAILGERPVDELARRLFASGGVQTVHANNAVVTVELTEGWKGEDLLDVIRGLYIHYPTDGGAGADDPADGAPADADEAPASEALADADAAPEPDAASSPEPTTTVTDPA
jgi:hypothetical protein